MTYFHILTHAIFKALLFLCAGFIIHRIIGSQDIRGLGGLVNISPLVGLGALLSFLSLCGVPFTCGFYSKDLIIEGYLLGGKNLFICLSFLVGVFLTVVYSFRLVYYMLLYNYQGLCIMSFKEDKGINFSIGVIGGVGVFFGCIMQWLFVDYSGGIYLSLGFKTIAVFVVFIIFRLFICYVLYGSLKEGSFISFVKNFVYRMWFLSLISSYTLGI